MKIEEQRELRDLIKIVKERLDDIEFIILNQKLN